MPKLGLGTWRMKGAECTEAVQRALGLGYRHIDTAEMYGNEEAVGEALGARFAIDVDKRIQGAAEVGRHKTSMLQDLELGRPLEIEAILGAVVELASWVDVPMPISTAVLELTRTRAAMRG